MKKKIEFQEFFSTVPVENQDFVKELHNKLMELGCKTEIKEAKSGYMVSYLYRLGCQKIYQKYLIINLYLENLTRFGFCKMRRVISRWKADIWNSFFMQFGAFEHTVPNCWYDPAVSGNLMQLF